MRISDWSSDVCSSDLLIGLKHIGADLVAPSNVGFRLVSRIRLCFATLQFSLVHAGFQHVHGFGLVLVLRSLVLASDDDSSRNVGDAHRRIGRIDMLPRSEEHTSELKSLMRISYA